MGRERLTRGVGKCVVDLVLKEHLEFGVGLDMENVSARMPDADFHDLAGDGNHGTLAKYVGSVIAAGNGTSPR